MALAPRGGMGMESERKGMETAAARKTKSEEERETLHDARMLGQEKGISMTRRIEKPMKGKPCSAQRQPAAKNINPTHPSLPSTPLPLTHLS